MKTFLEDLGEKLNCAKTTNYEIVEFVRGGLRGAQQKGREESLFDVIEGLNKLQDKLQ